MAYTGTLPPKIPRDAGVLPSSRPTTDPASEAEATGEQGTIPYYFVLIFTFFQLARPQDFVRSLRVIPFAKLFAIAAIFTWALGAFSRHIKFRPSKELNLMLGLTVWFILGVPFSYWPSNSLYVLTAAWLKIIMIFLVMTQTVTTTKRLRNLLWVMFISGLLATSGTLVMGMGHLEDLEDKAGRLLGLSRGFFFGNYLGIAAGVLMPYMAAMLMHMRSFFKQLMIVGCFVTLIVMVVLTASRSNLIIIVVSLLLIWAIMLRHSMKAKLIGVVFALGLMLSIAFAPHAFWVRVGTLWGSEASFGNVSAEASAHQRRDLLLLSIQVTLEKPVFGLGLGNFHHYSGEISRVPNGTHNTFTQFSSEAGIPASIMFFTLLVTGITRMRRMVRGCRGRPELAEESSLAKATIVGILSFMMGACFAHLAFEYFVYYLAVIGVALQTIYALKTGESLEVPKAGRGKTNGNGGDKNKGNGWRRLTNVGHEARA